MMRNFLLRVPVHAWRRVRVSSEVTFGFMGASVKLAPDAARLPIVTRFGTDPKDRKSPFYETRPAALVAAYPAYRNSMELKHSRLYADVRPIAVAGLHPIDGDAIEAERIVVRLGRTPYQLPATLREHKERAVDLFKQLGKINAVDDLWENNRAVSIRSLDGNGLIQARFAEYYDQVATNLTLDWESRCIGQAGPTIRSTLEAAHDGRLPPLEQSCLANTLGTAVMVFDRDLQPLLRFRNETMSAIPHRGLHCTASGVLELAPDIAPGDHGFDVFRWGMEKEIRDELGLEPDQYRLFPVAFARELPRGGKPQLFWAAVSLVDDATLAAAAATAPEATEYVQDAENPLFQTPPEAAARYVDQFTYEGLACFEYADQFVAANHGYLSELVARS